MLKYGDAGRDWKKQHHKRLHASAATASIPTVGGETGPSVSSKSKAPPPKAALPKDASSAAANAKSGGATTKALPQARAPEATGSLPDSSTDDKPLSEQEEPQGATGSLTKEGPPGESLPDSEVEDQSEETGPHSR